MKYNDRELVRLGEQESDLEGILHHIKPQQNDWTDWYQRPCFKERYFKLINNLLFYYRVEDKEEPLGVLVLENAQVAYERPHRGIPFAFSLIFKVNDRVKDDESKHIFSCRCDADVSKWVTVLKKASYEYWRSQYVILKTKISMKTGVDPVLEYMKSKNSVSVERTEVKRKAKETKPTFYSHIESSSFIAYTSDKNSATAHSENDTIDNLISL
ncbi:unnamed protein product [Acanthoscelides obtectus]|uniref:Pleckstrin homology domain-containing family J member 1 n=1 Tax=Acanthoscelides obtectus TaxID=200917 RepID=A0A9P0P0X8_ACAOB|nr:unnamed protein product [Acanthoscelides obtectus]CAK1627507.1 Pleckstrin homology domain-containing family J member 1 [Acanthoscelides obtectus]